MRRFPLFAHFQAGLALLGVVHYFTYRGSILTAVLLSLAVGSCCGALWALRTGTCEEVAVMTWRRQVQRVVLAITVVALTVVLLSSILR
jgi:hypothetical protein